MPMALSPPFGRRRKTSSRLPNGGRRFYLVQDFEPSFYPGDAHHTERAENTYRAGFHCITLGRWLTKLLRERYGATADYFDFAVDPNIYRPRRRRAHPDADASAFTPAPQLRAAVTKWESKRSVS